MDYLSLCLICKDENDYLQEWLDYHILAGVDRFYIYDNGSVVSLRESLASYIERGWAVVVDIAGPGVQLHAYDHCLRTFGAASFWLGFIDTDEFLVPKSGLDLKAVLKEYEPFGGLAVSSLFFGSNGHTYRPAWGQLASYTLRTHPVNFKGNWLVKCIVRPSAVLYPTSPHEFAFREGAWCVNERGLRVEGQLFPPSSEKIQLNHYFCRSLDEIARKISRKRGDMDKPQEIARFQAVNQQATFPDTAALEYLARRFAASETGAVQMARAGRPDDLLSALAGYTARRNPQPNGLVAPCTAGLREEISQISAGMRQLEDASQARDYPRSEQILLNLLRLLPAKPGIYIGLANAYIAANHLENAWATLTRAWQLAPNSYSVLSTMVYYFIKARNFETAEKTCRLLLEIAPQDLLALAFLTEALSELGRWEEALKVGIPVLELEATFGELPPRMGLYLARRLAARMQERRDYAAAARLWDLGLRCQPGDLEALLGGGRALAGQGDWAGAKRRLEEARQIAPENPDVQSLLREIRGGAAPAKKHRH